MTSPLQSADVQALNQILLELGKQSTQLGKQSTQLAVITEKLQDLPDHETRIRKLEAWRYGLPLAGLMSGGALVVAIYELVHR